MVMKQIYCHNCGKFLLDADPERHIGIQVQDSGFTYKFPILYKEDAEPLYFCGKTCTETYYDLHIPKNEKVTKALEDLKAEIPQMAEQTVRATKDFMTFLKNLKNKNHR